MSIGAYTYKMLIYSFLHKRNCINIPDANHMLLVWISCVSRSVAHLNYNILVNNLSDPCFLPLWNYAYQHKCKAYGLFSVNLMLTVDGDIINFTLWSSVFILWPVISSASSIFLSPSGSGQGSTMLTYWGHIQTERGYQSVTAVSVFAFEMSPIRP